MWTRCHRFHNAGVEQSQIHHSVLDNLDCKSIAMKPLSKQYLHVQVVGGLIEQQDVRLAEGDAGEHHPRLLPACEQVASDEAVHANTLAAPIVTL